MNRVPDEEMVLVPGGSLITATAEEGRALALMLTDRTNQELIGHGLTLAFSLICWRYVERFC